MTQEQDLKICQNCDGCYFDGLRLDYMDFSNPACALGRPAQFAKNGGIVTTENGHTRIENRFCSAYRQPGWAKNKPVENLEIILRAEILVRTEVFVYIDDFSYKKIEETLQSLKTQILKPSLVVAVCNGTTRMAKLLKMMDDCGLPYRIEVMKQLMTKLEAIDVVAAKSKSTFYQVLDQGQTLHRDFLANLDEAINERLEKLLFIKGNDTQGDTVALSCHGKFLGNQPCKAKGFREEAPDDLILNTLEEKILFLANLDKQSFFIKTVDEILNNVAN